jgi:hypothetical protein
MRHKVNFLLREMPPRRAGGAQGRGTAVPAAQGDRVIQVPGPGSGKIGGLMDRGNRCGELTLAPAFEKHGMARRRAEDGRPARRALCYRHPSPEVGQRERA